MSYLVLQMHQFNNRSNDMTMRVSSLDYLGQIASRLRKHAVSSNMDQETLDTIVNQVGECLFIYLVGVYRLAR